MLDETYRKAGKMDVSEFMTRFDVSRLEPALHTGLLAGKQQMRTIRTELYKLNVYGKSSCFEFYPTTNSSHHTLYHRRGRIL